MSETVKLSEQEVMRAIVFILMDHLGVDKVHENHRLFSDLGADDLDGVELLMAIEEKFNIEISNEDWFTIADFYAESLQNKKDPTVREICEFVYPRVK